MLFLLEYDRGVGVLTKFESFSDAEREVASKARLDLEIRLMSAGVRREVVLLEAASEQALKATHSRYFGNVEELTKAGEHVVSSREMKAGPTIPRKERTRTKKRRR